MPFIKTQHISYKDDGSLAHGTASIVDTKYDKNNKYHSRQIVRECLGKIVYLDRERKSGIFLSPTRGLVEYSALSDTFQEVKKDDPRLANTEVFPSVEIHTVFGDTYLLLKFLEKEGLLTVLRKAFPKNSDYERLLCHMLHAVLKDGSKIACDNFIAKSVVSYLLSETPISSLHSDTSFFYMMGSDHARMAFFTSFISAMRENIFNVWTWVLCGLYSSPK